VNAGPPIAMERREAASDDENVIIWEPAFLICIKAGFLGCTRSPTLTLIAIFPSFQQGEASGSATASSESTSGLADSKHSAGTPPGIQVPLNSYRGRVRGRGGRGGRSYGPYGYSYGYNGGRGEPYNSYYPQRGRGRGPPPAPPHRPNTRVLMVARAPIPAAPAYSTAADDDDGAPPPGFAPRLPPGGLGQQPGDDDDGPPPGFEDDGPPPGFEDAPPGFEHVRPGVRGRGGRGRGAGRRGGRGGGGGGGRGGGRTAEMLTAPRPASSQQQQKQQTNNNYQNNTHQQPQLALLVDNSAEALRQIALGGVTTLQVVPAANGTVSVASPKPATMGVDQTAAAPGVGGYGAIGQAGGFGAPGQTAPLAGLGGGGFFSSGNGVPGTAAAFPKSIW
jgi:hypothetical protein